MSYAEKQKTIKVICVDGRQNEDREDIKTAFNFKQVLRRANDLVPSDLEGQNVLISDCKKMGVNCPTCAAGKNAVLHNLCIVKKLDYQRKSSQKVSPFNMLGLLKIVYIVAC